MEPGRWNEPKRAFIFDVALGLAAALTSLGIASSLTSRLSPAARWTTFALLGLHGLVLAFRRRAPWATFVVNMLSGSAVVVIGVPAVVLHFVPLVALYSVSAQKERRESLVALGATVVALLVVGVLQEVKEDVSTVVGNLVAVGSVWGVGNLVHSRRLYVSQLERRTLELEEAREELALKVASEERLRIARELHDIVAHSLSVIAVQSGVGAHVIGEKPDEARRALVTIEDASRRALQEMRGMLSMLRDGNAERSPLPKVEELPRLIERVSEAGPEVQLQVNGDPRPLPPSIELTAYRIVQESLTNVVKHAKALHARVVLTYAATHLTIDVTDDGIAHTSRGVEEGHGLTGMRERVEMFQGVFASSPLREGGFHVHARLPLETLS